MQHLRILWACLGLVGLGLSQQPFVRILPGRGGKEIPGASREQVQALYQQAAAAVTATPAMVAPRLLAEVANDEMNLFPEQGLADFKTAFDLARALAPPTGPDDAVGQARETIKVYVERSAVGAALRQRDQEQALAWTRLADIPKGQLYDQVIEANLRGDRAGRGGRGGRSTSAATAAGLQPVLSLVEECERGGSYPYMGVAALLQPPFRGGPDQTALLRDGYQWAGNETDPTAMQAAEILLQQGHRVEPQLDSVLETTLVAMLERLGQAGASSDSAGAARQANTRLYTLLRQLDPAQADALASQFSEPSPPPGMSIGAATPIPPGGGVVMSALGSDGTVVKLGFANETMAAAAMTSGQLNIVVAPPEAAPAGTPGDASGEAGGASAFRALLAQAESLQRKDPVQALALAGQAAGMLDDALWSSDTVAVMRLAMLDSNLGAVSAAGRLVTRALHEANVQARALDTTYLGADSSQQAQIAQGLEAAQFSILQVYSLAARLDFIGTAERAEAGQFVLLKPLVLARVALVGEVGEPAPGRGRN